MFSWLGWHRRAGKRKWLKVASGATQDSVKDMLAKLKLAPGETLTAPATTDPNQPQST
jgi:hypothetical protein